MCTNFTSNLDSTWSLKHLGLELGEALPLEAYPGYGAPFLRRSSDALGLDSYQLRAARFGLIPYWTRESEMERISRFTYNARSESVSSKPSYKKPYLQRQWGVVLVKDFFEPCYESGQAQRMRISLHSDEPFGIACLWDEWAPTKNQDGPAQVNLHTPDKEKRVVLSFSMLTLNAEQHPVMSRMHAPAEEKRTPLVLTLDQFKPWLEASHEEAKFWWSGQRMPALKAQLAPNPRFSKKSESGDQVPLSGASGVQGQLF